MESGKTGNMLLLFSKKVSKNETTFVKSLNPNSNYVKKNLVTQQKLEFQYNFVMKNVVSNLKIDF